MSVLSCVPVAGAYVMASGNQWTGGDTAILIASVIAALGVVWAAVGGLLRRFRSVRLSYTDKSHSEKAERFLERVPVGLDHELVICIRVQRKSEFHQIHVRPEELGWYPKWQWFKTHRRFDKTPPGVLKVLSLDDGERRFFKISEDDWKRNLKFYPFPATDDRAAGGMCEFTPSFQRGAGDAVFLWATVHASSEWDGYLNVSLTNGVGDRVWRRLQLTAGASPPKPRLSRLHPFRGGRWKA